MAKLFRNTGQKHGDHIVNTSLPCFIDMSNVVITEPFKGGYFTALLFAFFGDR